MKTLKNINWICKIKNLLNKLSLYICVGLIITSCNSQAQKNEQLLSNFDAKFSQVSDTSKPKISYKVNKQFDKNGNIVKYDSTYSYIYKGGEGKGFSTLNADSIFNSFNTQPFKFFEKQNNSFFNNDLFFNDNFFDNTFFEKQIQFNSNFFNQIDTLQHNYLNNGSFKKI